LADARAIYPALATATATPAADRARLGKLASWLGRYGIGRNAYGFTRPAAGGYPVRHYGLWVDISGVAHLYGGEAALLTDLGRRLTGFGLTAHLGLADTLGAAHALAWHGGTGHGHDRPMSACIAPTGATLASIADLPVAALRLDAACVKLLGRLGLKTIGNLSSLPRATVERRFHSREAGRRVLLRLDQALGTITEPRRPMAEPPVLAVEALFAEPLISSDGLMAETARLVDRLCSDFKARNLGVRALRLALYRSDGSRAEAKVGTSRPECDWAHLMRLMAERLSSLDLGFGADMLVLEATRAEPLPQDQHALTTPVAGQAVAEAEARLVDSLTNRLGSSRVMRLRPADSHWPERAEMSVPALKAQMANSQPGGPQSGGARSGGELAWHVAGRALRPALLLTSPEPIEVIARVPDGPPVQFLWRRVIHRVAAAAGPERIEPEWWRNIGADRLGKSEMRVETRVRDYYRLQDTAGARFWVFRAGRYEADTDATDAVGTDADGVRAGGGNADGVYAAASAGPTDAAPSPAWFVHGIIA
jgi:protein ImuB